MQNHLLGSGVEEIRAYEQEFRYPFYGFRHAYPPSTSAICRDCWA